MHEHLKNSFLLNQETKPFLTLERGRMPETEFKSQIGDWQAIFSGHKYGTHFLIYAKILGERRGESFVPNKLQLYLQNYKGSMTIGIIGPIHLYESTLEDGNPLKDPRYKQKFYVLDIGLQGLNSNSIIKDIDLEDLRFKSHDLIYTRPFFLPIDPKISKIFQNSKNKSALLDSLFMEREGDDIYLPDDKCQELDKLKAHLEMPLKKNYKFPARAKRMAGEIKAFLDKSKRRDKEENNTLLGRVYPCIPAYSVFHLV